ncbi:suppressor protein SRP40-like, partial [Cynoglossus semilaevis]|uniref:suppressor protein SRP40-like n=1 Tax=Cynoglossus semilaevis TaxID=244447 RepID=UPI000D629826
FLYAGVDGAKVENVSLEICQHPCKDLVNLLTEIHGLRFVTNNLLEDLEKISKENKEMRFYLSELNNSSSSIMSSNIISRKSSSSSGSSSSTSSRSSSSS